ncbi:MAG: class III poly(R)-hydroxyalkanoic acid synthase subunit PhaC [Candidatus Kapaibacterium sp.]|nr:MAG: class III poly(R)-hydroxyalkanoic acid synthase subunit PhaC [Candidatus Kapabacteria bacterium]
MATAEKTQEKAHTNGANGHANGSSKNIPFLDPMQFAKDMSEMGMKVVRGMNILKNMTDDDLAVGQTPREKVLDIDFGKIKLYRYKSNNVTCKVPLLINFAVVNKEYIIDIQPDRSFAKKMLELGHDVYTIDWGYPTRADRYRTMEDYMDYLDQAIDYIRKTSPNKKTNLMGVCQGGTAAIIYSSLFPNKINTLTTAVTPFEMRLENTVMFKWAQHVDPDPIADAHGMISGEAMNAGFLMVKPMQRMEKFHMFLNMMDDKPKVQNFLRMEKWLFDSPGQPGEAYRTYTRRVFMGNELSDGTLTVDDRLVDMNNIQMPVLTIYASHDHLVPPESTRPIHEKVGTKDKTLVEFPGGHVGVFVSSAAQKHVAPAISQWLVARSQVA